MPTWLGTQQNLIILPDIVIRWYLVSTSATNEWFRLKPATACKDESESLIIKKCFFLDLLVTSRARRRPVRNLGLDDGIVICGKCSGMYNIVREKLMYEKQLKVRPLLNKLGFNWTAIYKPTGSFSTDESMIPFKGRSMLKG
jgi:hypothetical protein